MSFRSEIRKQDSLENNNYKYIYGSSDTNQSRKRLCKKWGYETIKEILLKRYNLLRQAAEIYFNDSKSIFISFFTVKNRKNFFHHIQGFLERNSLNPIIIDVNEKFFSDSKFCVPHM